MTAILKAQLPPLSPPAIPVDRASPRSWARRLQDHIVSGWPRARRQIPRDLLILAWLAIVGQHLSAAWVMTDSVHTSVALVVWDAPVKVGELAVFRYSGRPIKDYYREVPTTRALVAIGLKTDVDGPRQGDRFVKYLVGIPGDRIEVEGDRVFLSNARGRFDLGRCKPKSLHGVALTPIRPQVIPDGYVYMWSPIADALDSRYELMGLVPRSAITGKALKLW